MKEGGEGGGEGCSASNNSVCFVYLTRGHLISKFRCSVTRDL